LVADILGLEHAEEHGINGSNNLLLQCLVDGILAEEMGGGIMGLIKFGDDWTSAARRDDDAGARVDRPDERCGQKCGVDCGRGSELEKSQLAISEVGVYGGGVGVELEVQLCQGLICGLANDGRNVGVWEVVNNFVNCGGHGDGEWSLGGAGKSRK
jgi:hypothetical protein